jgi:hypothetical protein
MRPLLFAVVLLSVGTSVPALTAESDDARMTADTLGSKTADAQRPSWSADAQQRRLDRLRR